MHRDEVEIANVCPPHVTPADFERRGPDNEFCRACNKHVYDLSAMTERDAQAFLQLNAAALPCIAYTTQADGSLVHVPEARLRRRSPGAAFAARTTAFGVSALSATALVAACNTPAPSDEFPAPTLLEPTTPADGTAPVEGAPHEPTACVAQTDAPYPALPSTSVPPAANGTVAPVVPATSAPHSGHTRGLPRYRGASKACSRPFTVDENGIKRLKPGCD